MGNLISPTVGTLAAIGTMGFAWSTSGSGFNLTYHLYKNSVSIDDATVLSDFTECDFSGYSSVVVAEWNYGSVFLDGSGRATITGASSCVFTRSAGATDNDVYGYYVTDAGGNLVFAQEANAPPIPMTTPGQTITVNPLFTLRSQFSHP